MILLLFSLKIQEFENMSTFNIQIFIALFKP